MLREERSQSNQNGGLWGNQGNGFYCSNLGDTRGRRDYSTLWGFTWLKSWSSEGHDFEAYLRSLRQGDHGCQWRRESAPESHPELCLANTRTPMKLRHSLQSTCACLRQHFLSAELESPLSRAHLLDGLCWGSSFYSCLHAVSRWTRNRDAISCNKVWLWAICSIPSWNAAFWSRMACIITQTESDTLNTSELLLIRTATCKAPAPGWDRKVANLFQLHSHPWVDPILLIMWFHTTL